MASCSHLLDAFAQRSYVSRYLGERASELLHLRPDEPSSSASQPSGTGPSGQPNGYNGGYNGFYSGDGPSGQPNSHMNGSSSYRHFVEWFKPAHEIHQQFHVAAGPCTAACSTAPSCHSYNCEFLLPIHAGYHMLLRLWMRRHGASSPCDATDAQADFDVDECLPYVFPLVTVRSLCSPAGREKITYAGEEEFL